MKKIKKSHIFGANNVELGAKPTENTNIFQTSQDGAIKISGKITSDVPVVKYVVYASKDNGLTKRVE